jgi:hypothetical protein
VPTIDKRASEKEISRELASSPVNLIGKHLTGASVQKDYDHKGE